MIKRFIKDIIGYFNFTVRIKLNGLKFKIPIIKSIGVGNISLEEKWFPQLLSKLLPVKKGCFIDIGANTGQTLLELRSISTETEYYGLEPNPTCVFYCINLIKKNKFKNSYILPIGIFSENRLLSIYLDSEVASSGSIISDLRPGFPIVEKLIIPVLGFKEVQNSLNIENIAIIKIDVEGAELEVLRSLKETIKSYNPIIICEILWAHNTEKLETSEERNNSILSLLTELSYKVFRLIKSKNNKEIIALEQVTQIESIVYTKENANLCDYLMIHNNIEPEINLIFKNPINKIK